MRGPTNMRGPTGVLLPYVIVTKSDGKDMTLFVGKPVSIVHDGTRFPCVVHSIGTELEPEITVLYLGANILVEDLNNIQLRLIHVDGPIGGKRRTRGRTKGGNTKKDQTR